MQRMQNRYLGAAGQCESVSTYEETNRISWHNLAGLWIILGGAIACAVLLALLRRCCWPERTPTVQKGDASVSSAGTAAREQEGGAKVALYRPEVV